ncbi:MAG: type II toxin-antitoxin system RelE/ParE family toxin [Trueperaceae bacterium]|nr:MAG: type II toxin-antitoxin system RelE/ParE family toxin [Trueperaceae bacterium]
MYQLFLERHAVKALKRLPLGAKERLKTALDDMKDDPFGGDVKALTGRWKGFLRRRVGPYRILFRVDSETKVIRVESIAHRREAY